MKQIVAPAEELALAQLLETYCVGCGCTESVACATPSGACYWVAMHPSHEYGLCSACVDVPLEQLLESPFLRLPDGTVMHVKMAKRREPRCRFCGGPHGTLLCDFKKPSGKSCDAKMCFGCSTPVGPDLDYCPDHRGEKRPS